jgi:hypothetical protein
MKNLEITVLLEKGPCKEFGSAYPTKFGETFQ